MEKTSEEKVGSLQVTKFKYSLEKGIPLVDTEVGEK